MSDIQARLFKLIQDKTGVSPSIDDTMDALKIDSLAMAELTVEVEKAFAIRIDDDVTDVTSLSELIDYIRAKSRASRAESSTD